jgi:hypothetical protein
MFIAGDARKMSLGRVEVCRAAGCKMAAQSMTAPWAAPDKATAMTRDLDRATAALKKHRAWAERARRTLAGDRELLKVTEWTIARGERILRRVIMRNADAEGAKRH